MEETTLLKKVYMEGKNMSWPGLWQEMKEICQEVGKSRYFTSRHPNLTIITDHKPICKLFNEVTRQINNKRLSNLRRKCDGFIFRTIYARGIDNTTDAISRIKDWQQYDEDRFQSVDDSRDTDDGSIHEENKIIKETAKI